MNKTEIHDIWQLVDEAIKSSTKREAIGAINQLNFKVTILSGSVDRKILYKLKEIISYAKEASGNVKDKEHWVGCVKDSWSVFENMFEKK